MKKVLLATLLAASFSANAQYMGTLPPNAEAGFNYTTDSDKFSTRYQWVGASHESGFGVRYGVGHGSGNDVVAGTTTIKQITYVPGIASPIGDTNTERVVGQIKLMVPSVSYSSKVLQATYVNTGENYSFYGAVGGKNIDASVSGYSESHTVMVADAELKLVMTDSLTLGVTLSRDVVESAGNIIAAVVSDRNVTVPNISLPTTPVVNGVNLEAGTSSLVTADTLAGDLDLQLSERLSLYAQVGITHFSDSNNRVFVNTKTTYDILPDYGTSLYIRTKYQHNDSAYDYGRACGEVSDIPVSTNNTAYAYTCIIAPYFSPEQRGSISPGAQIRKPYAGMVFTAAAEVGKQWTTVDSSTTSSVIYSWMLGVQTNPGRKTGTTFGVSVMGTNASITGNSGNYNWYGLNSWIKVPLQ